ncbi:MAG: hypothetical protein KA120_00235 [Candidatus Goldbacteria bacterium]|nr:hypothetical protein [Candidatus Goldiibacteriota bacterium]
MSGITEKEVKDIQNRINSRPRAIFGYKTFNNITRKFVTKKACEVLGVLQ